MGDNSMYTDTNFASKKALKEALAAGRTVRCHSPGPFPCPTNGQITLEGPHYPKPHSWYATATLKDGAIVPGSVK
jgi:hypothetical protein